MEWESSGVELQLAVKLLYQVCLPRRLRQDHRLLGTPLGVTESPGLGIGGGERAENNRILSTGKLICLLGQFHSLPTVAQ
jgi:hypothetical protein